MESISIRVDGPLTETHSGELTARISVSVDDWCFPEAEWRDFVLVLLGWWASAIRDLHVHGSAVLNFMDGPFQVRLNQEPGDGVLAEFVSRTARGSVTERVAATTRQQLAVAVSAAARSAADMARVMERTADANQLEAAAADLLRDLA